MGQDDNFLHTTHRTVTWFKKSFNNEELVLSPPFQRHAVWTNLQKSYLIDTILNSLPIPELYMQDLVDEAGEEKHVVVDGQQRIRAVLDYVVGNLKLDGDDVAKKWRGLKFDDLSVDDKKVIYNYKFVVRVLPPDLKEQDIRAIFARLNKNVVSLTDQELRNATYWGPFIKSIQYIADEDPFWAESGIFSANEHRRMLDHEFISELAIAHLHGPQNKKDRLDFFYQLYEESFEGRDELIEDFRKVTSEVRRLLPSLSGTRWRKKSDFYTMFLELSARQDEIPHDVSKIDELARRLEEFGDHVDRVMRLDEDEGHSQYDKNVITYAQNVARAASDKTSRIARSAAFARFVFQEEPVNAVKSLT